LRGWFELVFAVVPHLPFSFPRDFAKVQCVIITILAPTTPCASLVPTNELPASRLYRQPHGRETFPALHPRPCDRAAAPTPESSSVASARLFPENPAFAIQIQARRSPPARLPSRGWRLSTLQRFRYVAARSLARPPGQSRLATARAWSLELSSRWSPNLDVRFATRPSGYCRGRSLPGWS